MAYDERGQRGRRKAQWRPSAKVDPAKRDHVARVLRTIWCLEMRLRLLELHGTPSTYGSYSMPQWDGGVSPKTGRTYPPYWPRAAEYCIENELDPVRLVRSTFATASCERTFHMVPTMLLSQASRLAYDDVDMAAATRLTNELEASQNEFWAKALSRARFRNLSESDAAVSVLRDNMVNLSPLYRYCRLVALGCPEAAAAYRDAAVLMYVRAADGYDFAWGDVIPESLREESKPLREAL